MALSGLQIFELNSGSPAVSTDCVPFTSENSGNAQKTAISEIVRVGMTSGSVSSGKLANDAVNNNNISSGAIDNFKLGSGSVTSGSLVSYAVGGIHIVSGAINSFKLGSNAVISGKIQINAVSSGNIASGQIGANHLASGVMFTLTSGIIKSGDIGSAAVVSGNIASGAINQISAINLNNSQNYRLLIQQDDGTVAYNSGFMYNPADGTLFLGSGGIIISDVPSNNTIIAARSISNPTVPSGQVCVIVGDSILENNQKATGVVALGYSIGNSDGDQAAGSVALGWQTFSTYLGANNVGVGYRAANIVASGTANTVAVGAFALGFAANTSINTTAVGYGAAQNLRAGAQNSTYIGAGSNTGVASGLFPNYEMAFDGTGSGSNKINMGSTSHTRFWTNGVVESVNGFEVVPSGKPAVFSVNASGDCFVTSFASGSQQPQGPYLNAFSTDTQYNSGTQNTSKRMTLNNVPDSHGISLRSGNEIVFTQSGMYNIQFSAQFDKTDAGSQDFDVWFSLNSGNIANSNSQYTLAGNNAKMIAALNFFQPITASGQYMSINWSSANEHIRLLAIATQTGPDRPATPSVIVTVNKV